MDEFKRTYYNDDEQVVSDEISKDMPLNDLLKIINNKIKLATRNNKVFRNFKNILHSYNDKSSSKLTNCTLFNNLTENDVKTKEHATQINRIVDMLISKKKRQRQVRLQMKRIKTPHLDLYPIRHQSS